jgi:hypothetical protein
MPGTSSPSCCPSANGPRPRTPRHTLTTRYELAHWTGRAGDAAGVHDQCAELLPIYERVLGPETIAARNNLAYWGRKTDRGTD